MDCLLLESALESPPATWCSHSISSTSSWLQHSSRQSRHNLLLLLLPLLIIWPRRLRSNWLSVEECRVGLIPAARNLVKLAFSVENVVAVINPCNILPQRQVALMNSEVFRKLARDPEFLRSMGWLIVVVSRRPSAPWNHLNHLLTFYFTLVSYLEEESINPEPMSANFELPTAISDTPFLIVSLC